MERFRVSAWLSRILCYSALDLGGLQFKDGFVVTSTGNCSFYCFLISYYSLFCFIWIRHTIFASFSIQTKESEKKRKLLQLQTSPFGLEWGESHAQISLFSTPNPNYRLSRHALGQLYALHDDNFPLVNQPHQMFARIVPGSVGWVHGSAFSTPLMESSCVFSLLSSFFFCEQNTDLSHELWTSYFRQLGHICVVILNIHGSYAPFCGGDFHHLISVPLKNDPKLHNQITYWLF